MEQTNFPQQDEPAKQHGDFSEDPRKEGHVKEWQDRARVVLDAKEAVGDAASPRQSPTENEDVEEKSEDINMNRGRETSY